jgi:hypothetical protein
MDQRRYWGPWVSSWSLSMVLWGSIWLPQTDSRWPDYFECFRSTRTKLEECHLPPKAVKHLHLSFMLTIDLAFQRNGSARSVKEFNTQPIYLSIYSHDNCVSTLEFHGYKLYFFTPIYYLTKLTASRDSLPWTYSNWATLVKRQLSLLPSFLWHCRRISCLDFWYGLLERKSGGICSCICGLVVRMAPRTSNVDQKIRAFPSTQCFRKSLSRSGRKLLLRR